MIIGTILITGSLVALLPPGDVKKDEPKVVPALKLIRKGRKSPELRSR